MRSVTVNQHPNDADILLRVSTTGQAESDRFSLPTQEAACRAFAAARGWTVHAIQQDAISGETIYRPGFQAVLDDLASGRVGRVIVYDVDRAGRDTYVGATLLHACKEAGATLHIQQMPDLELGGTGPTAYMAETMFFMRLTQAAQELAGIRERTQRGRRARAESGKPIPGAAPLFGYEFTFDARGKVNGYVPHPVYAPVVQRIFRDVADGVLLTHLCEALTREGVPTRAQVAQDYAMAHGRGGAHRRRVGTHWQRGAISSMVQHPAYAGNPIANRNSIVREHGVDPETGQPRITTKQRVRGMQEAEVIALPTEAWPPLVTPELAARAQARLAANQEEAARHLSHAHRETTLLRGGYVYCFACGLPMTVQRESHPRRYGGKPYWEYRCKRGTVADGTAGRRAVCHQTITAAPLDADVWAHVVRLADADEEVIQAAMASWEARVGAHRAREAAQLRRAEHLVETARRDEANARRTLTAETDEHYAARLRLDWKQTVQALEKAETQLATLRERIAHDPGTKAYAEVTTWAQDWRKHLSTEATYAEKRQALHRLGLRVFVAPIDPDAAHPKRDRHFIVVLGWPQGVKQAIPWTVNPLVPGGYKAYLAQYYPGLEDDRSELAHLVPAETPDSTEAPGEEVTVAGVPGGRLRRPPAVPSLAATVGKALGEIGQTDAMGTTDDANDSGDANTPSTSSAPNTRIVSSSP
jgi:site-specific DNA recombinase